jgi:hypothetical protein
VVAYTTGNSEGDEEFKKVAETLARQIQNSKGFDAKKDTVVLRDVGSKDDFKGLIGNGGRICSFQFLVLSFPKEEVGPFTKLNFADTTPGLQTSHRAILYSQPTPTGRIIRIAWKSTCSSILSVSTWSICE